MEKLSKKMIGLLRLINDSPNGLAYFPSISSTKLEDYDLTVFDKVIITWAEKKGLIETKDNGFFGWLTEKGKNELQK